MKNGISEIDVEIKGHQIPWVMWVLMGIATVIISLGIMFSLILYGSVSFNKAPKKAIEPAIMFYEQDPFAPETFSDASENLEVKDPL